MQDGTAARNEGRAEGERARADGEREHASTRHGKHEEHGQGHQRSKSGGILGAFRDAIGKSQSLSTQIGNDEGHDQDVEVAKRASSIATALRQSQGRQRKGSLRKAAMAKMRERSSSLRKAKPPTITTTTSVDPSDEATAPGRFSYENAPLNSSSDSGWLPSGPNQGSVTSLSHRRSTRSNRRTSISAVLTPAEADPDDEWDYSETEWWGWVVLIATWIVFVVGMGSCLGVWSWAWDVGETPYAPPDLEDDATLPITGYYPALIVCTAVTSWVWVVVAWVGMKYFRHAKVGVDG